MNWFVRLIERMTCMHDVYVINPERPSWARCAVCSKPKRLY